MSMHFYMETNFALFDVHRYVFWHYDDFCTVWHLTGSKHGRLWLGYWILHLEKLDFNRFWTNTGVFNDINVLYTLGYCIMRQLGVCFLVSGLCNFVTLVTSLVHFGLQFWPFKLLVRGCRDPCTFLRSHSTKVQ